MKIIQSLKKKKNGTIFLKKRRGEEEQNWKVFIVAYLEKSVAKMATHFDDNLCWLFMYFTWN